MNKKWMITIFIGIGLAIFAVTTPVFAQAPAPQEPPYGPGWMMYQYEGSYAPFHDEMTQLFADKVGLSVEEVNASLLTGSTMTQIAEQQGFSTEDIYAWMNEVHSELLDQTFGENFFAQKQADWMNQSYRTMQDYGYGACRGAYTASFGAAVPVYRGGGYRMR